MPFLFSLLSEPTFIQSLQLPNIYCKKTVVNLIFLLDLGSLCEVKEEVGIIKFKECPRRKVSPFFDEQGFLKK